MYLIELQLQGSWHLIYSKFKQLQDLGFRLQRLTTLYALSVANCQACLSMRRSEELPKLVAVPMILGLSRPLGQLLPRSNVPAKTTDEKSFQLLYCKNQTYTHDIKAQTHA